MLARRIQQVNESATLALTARCKALKAAGKDIVALTAGELDSQPPPVVAEAVAEAFRRGDTRYTAAAGTLTLRAAIADTLLRDLRLRYAPEDVIVCCGGKHALYNLFQVLCDPGDEVIIPAPYWLSYPAMAELAAARPVFVRATAGFRIDLDALARAITTRSRLLVINSPSNPSGAVYPEADLAAIADLVRQHPRLTVISDEIYDRLVFGSRRGGRAPSLLTVAPDLRERVAVVNGVSKTYAMTGIRIGWAAGPRAVIEACSRLQSHSTSNPSSIAQAGAEAALRSGLGSLAPILESLERRRDAMVARLSAMPSVRLHEPEGAFYCFPDLGALLGREASGGRPLRTACDLADHLLEEAHIAVIPGDPFGAPSCVRLSYATGLGDIEKGLARMGEALASIAR